MPSPTRRLAIIVVSGALFASTLTACSSGAGPTGAGLSIVTSTDVYADIARQVAGPDASVTSFISDPSQDPHSYEADTRDQLALSRARVIIENGGGYDDFMDTLRRASGNQRAVVLNAVDISGAVAPAGGELNEHVWYDFGAVAKLVTRLTAALASAEPKHAAAFQARAAAFRSSLGRLEATEAAIRTADAGKAIAITEPVPLYLIQACGLVNKTPPAFSTSIENGSDTPAAVLQQTLSLFSQKEVRALVYNVQTSGPQTTAVVDAARQNGIAVVPVTETLPGGTTYLTWMQGNLNTLRAALVR